MDYCHRGQPNGADAMGLSTVKPTSVGELGAKGEISGQEAYRRILGLTITFDREVDVGYCDGEEQSATNDKEQ